MSKVKADVLANRLNTKEVPVDTVVAGSAKAWVNFDGTGTVAIRDSFNVSGLIDNGVGDYTILFVDSIANVNYCPTVSGAGVGNGAINVKGSAAGGASNKTVSQLSIDSRDSAGALLDRAEINVAIDANN